MKKIILSLIILSSVAISAEAQVKRNTDSLKIQNNEKGRFHHGDKNQMSRNEMYKQLNLTDEQKEQIKSLNTDFKTRMETLHNDKSLSAEQLKAKRQELNSDRKQKFEAILTADQKMKMKELHKEFAKNHKGKDTNQRLSKMQSTLNLTDDQMAKIKTANEDFMAKEKTIRDDKSLSAEQKKDQLKTLREEKRNSFKNYLTDEQVKKLEEMKNRKPMKTT